MAGLLEALGWILLACSIVIGIWMLVGSAGLGIGGEWGFATKVVAMLFGVANGLAIVGIGQIVDRVSRIEIHGAVLPPDVSADNPVIERPSQDQAPAQAPAGVVAAIVIAIIAAGFYLLFGK